MCDNPVGTSDLSHGNLFKNTLQDEIDILIYLFLCLHLFNIVKKREVKIMFILLPLFIKGRRSSGNKFIALFFVFWQAISCFFQKLLDPPCFLFPVFRITVVDHLHNSIEGKSQIPDLFFILHICFAGPFFKFFIYLFQGSLQFVHSYRLVYITVDSQLHSLTGILKFFICTYQHKYHIRIFFIKMFDDLETGKPGHTNIYENNIRMYIFNQFQCHLTI